MKCKHPILIFFCLISLIGISKLNAQSKTNIGLDLVEDFSRVIDGGYCPRRNPDGVHFTLT